MQRDAGLLLDMTQAATADDGSIYACYTELYKT
jgi:hypothetical protein